MLKSRCIDGYWLMPSDKHVMSEKLTVIKSENEKRKKSKSAESAHIKMMFFTSVYYTRLTCHIFKNERFFSQSACERLCQTGMKEQFRAKSNKKETIRGYD